MIKHINHQNFLTTPFVAVKQWELFSIQNDDVVLIEPPDSSPEYPVALEYLDFNTDPPVGNRDCNIALEQQESDTLEYQEGVTGSGIFYPDAEATNTDGTYKRMVHAQTKLSFYNQYRNPTQMFGMEFIDFPLGKTNRELSDVFRLFTIPRHFFGDRLVEGSIRFYDTSLDDNVEIYDDGYQNLLAGANLFSKVQEVRGYNSPEAFENIIMDGVSGVICPTTASEYATASNSPLNDDGGTSVAFLYGTAQTFWSNDAVSTYTTFLSGVATASVVVISASEASVGVSGSMAIAFYSGSISSLVYVRSGSDAGASEIAYLSGSLNNIALPTSASEGTGSSVLMTYLSGSLNNIALVRSSSLNTGSISVAFLQGLLFG